MTPDLAIIELNRIVNLKPGFVSPICLPSKHVQDKPTKKIPIHAYVAGWGAMSSQCDSNDNGPSPHKMCKFPFVWKGRTHNRCIHEATPSVDNRICNIFFKRE